MLSKVAFLTPYLSFLLYDLSARGQEEPEIKPTTIRQYYNTMVTINSYPHWYNHLEHTHAFCHILLFTELSFKSSDRLSAAFAI